MNHNEEVPDFLGGPGDMSRRGQENLWQSRNVLPNPDSKALARKKRDDVDRLNGDLEVADANITMWMSKYEEAEELRKKAEHERDLLKEMMHEKLASKKYKVRQIAILALALCRKALVVPKNKKKIAELFSHLTGSSQNTISQNLCDTYTDEEIQDVAEPLKESMPELAEYLIENKFAG